MKKETVIGIIGNTQGVRRAAKPLKKEIKNSHHIPPASFSSNGTSEELVAPSAAAFISNENFTSSGGKHCFSSQTMKYTFPSILKSLEDITFIFCVKIASFPKYFKTISKLGSNSSIGFPSVTPPISS